MHCNDYSLIKLDTTNDFHINFTYEILKKRFEAGHINISDNKLPTIEQHISLLNSERFHCYYIGAYKNIEFCTLYVINGNYEIGFFLNPKGWKTNISTHRKTLLKQVDLQSKKIPIGQQIAIHQVITVFNLMLEERPYLKSLLTAKINYTNKFSRLIAEASNFNPVYITYNYGR